jgi:ribosomal protein L37AE/L43A
LKSSPRNRLNARLVSLHYEEKIIPFEDQQEHDCPFCGHLLFKGKIGPGGSIELKCRKCKELIRFHVV